MTTPPTTPEGEHGKPTDAETAAKELMLKSSDYLNRRCEWSEGKIAFEISKTAAIITKHFAPLRAELQAVKAERDAAKVALGYWSEFGAQFIPASCKDEKSDALARKCIMDSTTSSTTTIHQFINEVHQLRSDLATARTELEGKGKDSERLDKMHARRVPGISTEWHTGLAYSGDYRAAIDALPVARSALSGKGGEA